MKIIGYFTTESHTGPQDFVDEVVPFTKFSEVGGDFAIDITKVYLREDPRPFLNCNDHVAAWYSDYYDQDGNYSLHSLFPSFRTVYPGIIYRSSFLRECVTVNPLEELAKLKIISYIPKAIVGIT